MKIKKSFLPLFGSGYIFKPSDISNLIFWFNDTGLSNPSTNQFDWLDSVTGNHALGNFGTGTGVQLINGHNALLTNQGGGFTNNVINNITNKMTFAGCLLQTSYGAVNQNSAIEYSAGSSNYAWVGSLQAGTTEANFSYSGSLNNGIEFTPNLFLSTLKVFIFVLDGSGSNLTRLYLNGTHTYFRNYAFSSVNAAKVYIGGNFPSGSSKWNGTICEPLGYAKILNTTEINLLGGYLSAKYNAAWINI